MSRVGFPRAVKFLVSTEVEKNTCEEKLMRVQARGVGLNGMGEENQYLLYNPSEKTGEREFEGYIAGPGWVEAC